MKPRVFIGSSTESLEIAYSVQENLEHVAEVTVWTQGIFELSKYTVDSLVDQLHDCDLGIFVFAPDDITIFHGEEKTAVRDNVIFELGLFIGKLGKERNFIIIPQGTEESLHFPSDLLGLTPALYEPDRQDGNICASLGPACTKIGRVLTKLGPFKTSENVITTKEQELEKPTEYTEGDIKALLQSWMGSRPSSENSKVIQFSDVDRELRFKPGTTKQYIQEVAAKWRYRVEHEGEQTILFKQEPFRVSRNRDSWLSR